MAQGLPQVDVVSGFPMVDTATGLPIVTGAGDGCCCGTIRHCFQIFTVSWDCTSKTWGTVTAGAKSCLPSATPLVWTKYISTDANCSYYKYVDMGGANCTGDADCTGRADASTPSPPADPKDCCQTCCVCLARTDHECCRSDLASWVGGPMPSITYNDQGGPHNADIQATLDWYNATIAGKTLTISTPWNGCGGVTYSTSSGTDSFDIFFGCGGIITTSIAGSWGATYGGYGIGSAFTDCCKFVGRFYDFDTTDFTDVTPVNFRFDVIDNFCCGKNVGGPGTVTLDPCYKLPNTCNGICNPLP